MLERYFALQHDDKHNQNEHVTYTVCIFVEKKQVNITITLIGIIEIN